MKILNSLVPLKFQNNEIYSSDLMFIGLGTCQTTGIGMHVYNHLIPTIEREILIHKIHIYPNGIENFFYLSDK
jgi:hypothetical protein